MDKYQKRYVAHQLRKKKVLKDIIKKRYSERQFKEEDVDDKAIKILLDATKYCPSSCDRKAINLKIVDSRDEKALLGGILVGGVGWIHRASKIILLFADPIAYKAPGEINYMPYLDAGVVIQQILLMATAIDLKTAYANPNIRDMNKEHFKKIFGKDIFCGAVAVGK